MFVCVFCARMRSASLFAHSFFTINQASSRAPVWCVFALGSLDPVFWASHRGLVVVWQEDSFFCGFGAVHAFAGPKRHCLSGFGVCAPALPGGVGEGLVGLMCVMTFLGINSMRGHARKQNVLLQ